jgi:hypothetical protein
MKSENENEIGLRYKDDSGKYPRVAQCYLCKAWRLEKSLSPIEIPDQAGYVQKLACQECLREVMNEEKNEV